MLKKQRKTVGLALGSGGALGLAHVGVIHVLRQHGIPIDYLAGSSVGAWVAAHYGMFEDIDRLEDLTVRNERDKLRIFLEPGFRAGLIKGRRLEKTFERWLGGQRQFSDARIPFAVVATDLVKGRAVAFKRGAVIPALHASMAVPTIFEPVEYNGRVLVDGGVMMPVPDEVVRDMGADIVISVNLDRYMGRKPLTAAKKLTIGKVTYWSAQLVRAQLATASMQSSDVVIEPPVQVHGLLGLKQYFGQKQGEAIMRAGQRAASRQIEQIKQLVFGDDYDTATITTTE